MQNYKDLKVWEEGHMLTLKIYKVTMNFPDNEKYGLTNQIRRSAFSVPSNIAEGCGKFRQADIANYLLLLSKDLNYLSEDNFKELEESINKIKAMLISLIKKVRAKVIDS
jgi:hypothetical protein